MASPRLPDHDDDAELELEPLDPEILARERERAHEKTEAAVGSIDVDELYGHESQYSDLSVDWTSWKRFRFTTRHLLILTALLAMVLTVFLLVDGLQAVSLIVAAVLSGGWIWASRLERRQQAERARRREEFFGAGKKAENADVGWAVEPDAPQPRAAFKFAFSMKELFITMTVAAIVVALARLIGVTELATMCGMLALAGLVLHAVGYDPPRLFVLGWWLVLVIYLGVGLAAVMSSG